MPVVCDSASVGNGIWNDGVPGADGGPVARTQNGVWSALPALAKTIAQGAGRRVDGGALALADKRGPCADLD